MPNIELLNDQVSFFPIVTRDAAGNVVPAAVGDVDSVVSSNPSSLGMAIGEQDSRFSILMPASLPSTACPTI